MSKRGNGEGSIYYSETLKRWIGQYTYNGKRKSLYGKTRTEVKDKLNKALVNIVDNKYVDKSNYTLIDLINKYNDDDFTANLIGDVAYLRRKETANIIKKMSIANMPIQKIKQEQINKELLNINYYSNSTITKVYGMIKSAFDKAVILQILPNNMFTVKGLIIKPKSIKQDKKIDALTIKEQKLFIKELEKRYDPYTDIFYIALYTGMRIGEILSLKGIDIYDKIIHIKRTLTKNVNGQLIVGTTTKTYAGTRDIPITDLIEDIFKNVQTTNEYIFKLENGNFINPSTINSHFKRICKNANITKNVNTHMLRHTYATRCIESGMSAVVLSKLLGHADIETTLNTYTSVFNKFKEDEIQKYLDYMSQLH